MAKPSKRERKFQASGGVKQRLEKGTITNKGKLRKRKKAASARVEAAPPTQRSRGPKTSELVGSENLADLDLDSFFSKVAADAEQKALGEEESTSSSEVEEVAPNEVEGKKVVSSDDDSSSDDDDDDSDEDPDVAEERMKAEMAKMSQADPEFHDFLQENEQELLAFGKEDEEDDDMDEEEEASSKSKSSSGIHLTKELLAKLEKGTFRAHGTKSLKKLIAAYKSACHLSDADGANRGGGYVIDSSKIFDDLMVLCLKRCHEEFRYHLLDDSTSTENMDEGSEEHETKDNETAAINPKKLESSEKWSALKATLQSFFRSTLHVMSEAKEPELLTFILKALVDYIPFLSAFPRIADQMLRSLTSLWSAPLDTSEDYQVVRLNAFFRIRQLALTQPFPFIEDILKKTYLAYAKRAKFGTAASVTSVLPTLTFMGNCLCELYSLDLHSSYQHCFVYIRQLALLLRAATHKKTPEAMQQVYCWQYVHCLKLWVAVLSDAVSGEEEDKDTTMMKSLVYPLTEVILGTVRFAPAPTRHMPLRLHCVRLLQQLAAAAETFIPTSSLLLECFEWKEWYMAPKKSQKSNAVRGGLQIDLLLKLLPKEDTLRTHEQREAGINALFLLLNREVELYRYSPGFPEFAIRIIQQLRRFAKDTNQPRWRALAKSCIETCQSYTDFAVQARSKLQEAPKDIKRLECLRPITEKSMYERHEDAIKREQLQKQQLAGVKAKVPKRSAPANDDGDDADVQPKKKQKSKKKKAKKQRGSDAAQAKASGAMPEQEDQLEEGVDWSDED